jgi:hypothetical protein
MTRTCQLKQQRTCFPAGGNNKANFCELLSMQHSVSCLCQQRLCHKLKSTIPSSKTCCMLYSGTWLCCWSHHHYNEHIQLFVHITVFHTSTYWINLCSAVLTILYGTNFKLCHSNIHTAAQTTIKPTNKWKNVKISVPITLLYHPKNCGSIYVNMLRKMLLYYLLFNTFTQGTPKPKAHFL